VLAVGGCVYPGRDPTLYMTDEGITQLLLRWNEGDQTALDRLIPLVQAELHRVAHLQMRKEGVGHHLQTTALVNELYLRLVDQREANWQCRAHFFAVAATLMRRVLVDHARNQLCEKRGGKVVHLSLDSAVSFTVERSSELLALDEALERLAKLDPQKARIVELRHFGGLSVDETAAVLKLAPVTVMRHWKLAKAWLLREIQKQ
jgi:RNA polymerase sigma-70 factor (ECF subfamily)